MNIVICWANISGYMAACWRALHRTPGVKLFLIGLKSEGIAPFDESMLGDIPYRLLDTQERQDAALVRDLVLQQKPDVLSLSGWNIDSYRALASDPALSSAKKVLCVDTPLRSDWRQFAGRLALRSYLKHFDRIVVPGERAFAYARYLGFADGQIRKGLYAIDFETFAPCLDRRRSNPAGWPRQFLFVGRYAEEKGLDTLLLAYQQYRKTSADPWTLVCCGRGPLAEKLQNQPGVTDAGFVPPDRQPEVFSGAGAFVLASRYDPWPLVVVEAAAAGLPLVCSTACGSPVELLRDGHNGYTFATDDVAALSQRLSQIEQQDLPEWGERSRQLASAYRAELWPRRVFDQYLPNQP